MLLLYLMTSTVTAQQPDVVPLMSRDLTDIPGKEVLMITVEYPPGGSDPCVSDHLTGARWAIACSVMGFVVVSVHTAGVSQQTHFVSSCLTVHESAHTMGLIIPIIPVFCVKKV